MKITKQKYCESLMSKLSDGKLIPRFLCVEDKYTESGYHVKSAYLILKDIKGVIEIELEKSRYSTAAVKRVIDLIATETGSKYIKLGNSGVLDPNGLMELLHYWDAGYSQINIQYSDGSHVWTDDGIDLGECEIDLSRLNSTMILTDIPTKSNYLTKEAFNNYEVKAYFCSEEKFNGDCEQSLVLKFSHKSKPYSTRDFEVRIYHDGSGFAKNKDNLNFILTKYKSEIDKAINKTIEAFDKLRTITKK